MPDLAEEPRDMSVAWTRAGQIRREPDPIGTARIEERMQEIEALCTLRIVTHPVQQVARASDCAAFLYLGRRVEVGKTGDLFVEPRAE